MSNAEKTNKKRSPWRGGQRNMSANRHPIRRQGPLGLFVVFWSVIKALQCPLVTVVLFDMDKIIENQDQTDRLSCKGYFPIKLQ